MRWCTAGILALALAVLAARRGEAAAASLSETRAALAQWVEIHQAISKTRSDWQADREMLEQTVLLYERELKSIEEKLSQGSTRSAQADKERVEAQTLRDVSEAGLAQVQQFAGGFEAQLSPRIAQLPVPLQEILQKDLLPRIPADPASTNTPAPNRLQTLVGILNEMDKFNSAINVFNERRKNPAGEEVAVDTLYVGLGAAYFVDESGAFAGVGTPGPKGWEWAARPEIGPEVREAIRIYRNERPARFVSLPVVLR